jgi:hypothetical protein
MTTDLARYLYAIVSLGEHKENVADTGLSLVVFFAGCEKKLG